MWAMLGKLMHTQLHDLYLKTHMLDTLVKPVLSNYGCRVWGPELFNNSAVAMLASPN
jgi:hypothetical protein